MKAKIAILAMGAMMISGQAFAADIEPGAQTPDYTNYNEPAFQGLGVGVHFGGQFTNVELGHNGFSFDGVGADGLVGGVHAEYLFAAGNLRVGPYIEGGFSNVNTNFETPRGDIDLLNQRHYYGGGVKAGMVFFNSALIYVRGGIERANWEIGETVDGNVDSWVLGGGAEAMIADNVSLGLGLDYISPFDVEVDGHDFTDFVDETESFRGMVRLTYRR